MDVNPHQIHEKMPWIRHQSQLLLPAAGWLNIFSLWTGLINVHVSRQTADQQQNTESSALKLIFILGRI